MLASHFMSGAAQEDGKMEKVEQQSTASSIPYLNECILCVHSGLCCACGSPCSQRLDSRGACDNSGHPVQGRHWSVRSQTNVRRLWTSSTPGGSCNGGPRRAGFHADQHRLQHWLGVAWNLWGNCLGTSGGFHRWTLHVPRRCEVCQLSSCQGAASNSRVPRCEWRTNCSLIPKGVVSVSQKQFVCSGDIGT